MLFCVNGALQKAFFGILIVFGVVSTPVFSAEATSHTETHWNIPEEFWNCLLGNIDDYIAESDGIIAIYERLCPDPDQSKAVINSGPNVSENVNFGVVYRSAELVCLKELRIDVVEGRALLPRRPCDI